MDLKLAARSQSALEAVAALIRTAAGVIVTVNGGITLHRSGS